jgi:hypothetical protein
MRKGSIMKRTVAGLAAAALVALGCVPFSASADAPEPHHQSVEVPGTGVGAGYQTPQGETCAYVQTPDGWYAVSVGGLLPLVNFGSGSGTYNPDGPEGDNNNFCPNNWEQGS